jgi:hypothetical protein
MCQVSKYVRVCMNCVCIHVCMYLCMYVCMYVCMCVCVYACIYVCTNDCMYVCTYLHMYFRPRHQYQPSVDTYKHHAYAQKHMKMMKNMRHIRIKSFATCQKHFAPNVDDNFAQRSREEMAYKYMHTGIHKCTSVRALIKLLTAGSVCAYIQRMYTRTDTHTDTHTHVHIHMHKHIHIQIHIQIHIHIQYTYICTYIYIYTYTYTKR